jgi:hypothetical protein
MAELEGLLFDTISHNGSKVVADEPDLVPA